MLSNHNTQVEEAIEMHSSFYMRAESLEEPFRSQLSGDIISLLKTLCIYTASHMTYI